MLTISSECTSKNEWIWVKWPVWIGLNRKQNSSDKTAGTTNNKSGHQIVVIIFLSCIIVFLDIEQFYADILCSTTVNFYLGVVFFDIVILPVQYLFLLGYNKLFIPSIISFKPDEAEGIFGWVTFCLLFLIPCALGSVHYLSLGKGGGGAEKFELLPLGVIGVSRYLGGHHERFPMSRAPKCYNGFFIRA